MRARAASQSRAVLHDFPRPDHRHITLAFPAATASPLITPLDGQTGNRGFVRWLVAQIRPKLAARETTNW
jgi:hypothetical protein